MKLSIFHFSDIHLSYERQIEILHQDKILQILNNIDNVADEYMVIVSGDVANKGYKEHYVAACNFIEQLMDGIEAKTGKTASLYIVPGNHDIDFDAFSIDLNKVKKCYKDNFIEAYVLNYLSCMTSFFDFASSYGCFGEDERIVSKKCIDYDGKTICIVLVNSAPFSLLGGNADDMGYHYLSKDDLNNIEEMANCDFNVLVMHHSIEWFEAQVKSRLRNIIDRKYNLILTGHEHEPVGVEKKTNSILQTYSVQGNALSGNAAEGNGFCLITIDTDTNIMEGYSYIWEKDFYSPYNILKGTFQTHKGQVFHNNVKYIEALSKDNKGRNYDDYYVFPGIEFNTVEENEEILSWERDNEESLDELINKYGKINICGGHKSGKSVLASRMYRRLLSKGKYPVMLNADDIQKKKIDRTTRQGFEEQYEAGDGQFEKFTQLELKDRIVLLDDASQIEKNTLSALIEHFEKYFGCIVLFSEETMELNIKKQVIDVVEEKNIHLLINPFLYRTRYRLIKQILVTKGADIIEAEHRAREINDLINVQVKYFDLSPEFIINFVEMYESKSESSIRFNAGMNVFNIVYDHSLKSRVIDNSKESVEATLVINVLRELAYKMHFSKLSSINQTEFSQVVDAYNNEYRQNVNSRVALNVAINSKILKEKDNRIYFRDRTLVAYFVAHALNHKYNNGDDIKDNIGYLLKYLCFGINSDIVLFMVLISNNPQILYVIIEGAKMHFEGKEELSFDKNNIPFLIEKAIPVKNTPPDKEEKEHREMIIDEHEREIHLSELVELVDEYNYSEEDLTDIKNQVLVSFKYLEILSKSLPAFCQDMKAIQQDQLVELIYQCPNRFLYMIFNDISQNFKAFCEELYQEVSELRREKNQVAISMDSIRKAITQVSATLVLALYQLVAKTTASPQSREAINAFEYNENSNYRLQNLMMCSMVDDLNLFSKKAKSFDKQSKTKLEKSIIKYTVRDYFLRNNVKLYGEAESLMAYFFGGNNPKGIKDKIIRNRYLADRLNKENE